MTKEPATKRTDVELEFDLDGHLCRFTYKEQDFFLNGPDASREEPCLKWSTNCPDCGQSVMVESGLILNAPPLRCAPCRKAYMKRQYKR